MAKEYPIFLGGCDACQCGAGDFTIGEQVVGDYISAPASTGQLPGATIPNVGIVFWLHDLGSLPRGSYFLKYCSGAYDKVPGSWRGLENAGVTWRDVHTDFTAISNGAYFPPRYAGLTGPEANNLHDQQIANQCLGLGFYSLEDPTYLFWNDMPSDSQTAVESYFPKFRLYRYAPLNSMVSFQYDFFSSFTWHWKALLSIYNPSKGWWKMPAQLQATGGVSTSQTELWQLAPQTTTQVPLFFNYSDYTRTDQVLTIKLGDGTNQNADIVINMRPNYKAVRAAFVQNTTHVPPRKRILFTIANYGYGAGNALKSTVLAGGGVSVQDGPQTMQNGFGMRSGTPEFLTTQHDLQVPSGVTALTVTMRLTDGPITHPNIQFTVNIPANP